MSDWSGRIVMEATNQWDFVHDTPLDLGDQTGTERNAALMPGVRGLGDLAERDRPVSVPEPRANSCGRVDRNGSKLQNSIQIV